MDDFLSLYKERLNLQDATFSRIDHEEAMVAVVYRVALPNGTQLILKISARSKDYLREVYYLTHLNAVLPVPQIIQVVPPEEKIHGAILMEYLPGALVKVSEIDISLAHELGVLLATLHLNRVVGYGDPIGPKKLNADPRIDYTLKFEEGLDECHGHLPKALMERCRRYYDAHVHLLILGDGPCIVHRDFRPGNMIVSDGKLRGIIDWASARAGFAQEDFVPMEHGEWLIDPESRKAFVAGYASIRPVPDYEEMMPLLRLSKAIATIGFTVKRGTWNSSHARIYQFNRHFLETVI